MSPFLLPDGMTAAIGSRSIVGSTAYQVAIWDFYGNVRPNTGVQAGAVQTYVTGEPTPPPAPPYPW